MTGARIAVALGLACFVGCGGGDDGPDDQPGARLAYTDPGAGALRLIQNAASTADAVVLDFVVGDHPLAGYATGFNLPLVAGKVTLAAFQPGSALDPGQAPIAARAVIPDGGPLANALVVALSQKASGAGAVAGDAVLMPGAVLFTITLDRVADASVAAVFDGGAQGFRLPSGGLRDRSGAAVVDVADVAIGTLEVK